MSKVDTDVVNITQGQIRFLMDKIKQGGGGGGVVTLQYDDYNPNSSTQPSTVFPEWLIRNNVEAGQIVYIDCSNSLSGAAHLNMGKDISDNTVYKHVYWETPGIVLYITGKASSGGQTVLKALINSGSLEFPLTEWGWEIQSDYYYFKEVEVLGTNSVGDLNGPSYEKKALSFKSGGQLNGLIGVSSNIDNVGDIEIDKSFYQSMNRVALTFDVTDMWEEDPEMWMGTMTIDSNFQSYDFSQASVGDEVCVYVKNSNGLPLIFKPEYPNDFTFYLTDSADNTIEVPGLLYGYNGQGFVLTSDPVEITNTRLFILRYIREGEWGITNNSRNAKYLPRKLNANSTISGSSAPTTATTGVLGQTYIDTTSATAYICTAVDDVTPSYTWKVMTS